MGMRNNRYLYELLQKWKIVCINIRPLLIVEVCKMLLLFGKYASIILFMPSNEHGLSHGYKEKLT